MSFLASSSVQHSPAIGLARPAPSRVRRPTTLPNVTATSAVGRYLNRLLWLFAGR